MAMDSVEATAAEVAIYLQCVDSVMGIRTRAKIVGGGPHSMDLAPLISSAR